MKKSRMKLILALALCMALVCVAATAFAAEYQLWVGGVQVTSANNDNITKAIQEAIDVGTITGTVSGSASYDPDTNTLTLDDFNYTESGDGGSYDSIVLNIAIYYIGNTPLNLELKGESSVAFSDIKAEFSYGIYSDDGITVTGDGSLTATGGKANYESIGVFAKGGIEVKDGSLTGVGGEANNASCGVYAGSGITVTGSGSLTGKGATGNYSYGVYAYEGITVEGGTVEAQGEDQAFNKAPVVGSGYTTAKVWYGASKAGAAGPKGPDNIPENYYTEKYVRIASYCSVNVTADGSGTASASTAIGEYGTKVTLTATPNAGYQFKEWQVVSGGVTVKDNAFTIGTKNVEIRAIFEPIPVQPEQPDQPEQPGQIGQPAQPGTADLPQTGDTSSLMLWLALCALGAAGVLLLRRKACRR